MKDYTLTKKEEKDFILNYDSQDDKIIINYASGDKKIIPNTIENEEMLEEKMNKQVQNIDEIEDKAKDSIIYNIPFLLIGLGVLCFITIFIIFLIKGYIVFTPEKFRLIIPSLFLLGTASALSIRGTSRVIWYTRLLTDIRKNKLFRKKSYFLNSRMKVNENYLANVSAQTKEVIKSIPEDKNIFTYNSVDQMKYNDIITIIENINREDNLYQSSGEVKIKARKR